jgi:hypothetical protein
MGCASPRGTHSEARSPGDKTRSSSKDEGEAHPTDVFRTLWARGFAARKYRICRLRKKPPRDSVICPNSRRRVLTGVGFRPRPGEPSAPTGPRSPCRPVSPARPPLHNPSGAASLSFRSAGAAAASAAALPERAPMKVRDDLGLFLRSDSSKDQGPTGSAVATGQTLSAGSSGIARRSAPTARSVIEQAFHCVRTSIAGRSSPSGRT